MKQSPELTNSELPAIELFKQLGYQYFDAAKQDERESINEVVLVERLKASIRRINPWLNDNNLNKAVKTITAMQGSSLMEINENIHKYLKGSQMSVTQVIDGREQSKSIRFIESDPDKLDLNDYLVVNQMKFKGVERNSIPDIVVFINGLPLAVIECKSPKLENAASDAISDLIYYQRNSERLFRYNVLCVGIYGVGGKYGAIGAKEGHYNFFKSDDLDELKKLVPSPTRQDILLFNLFKRENFIDLMRNFVIFEISEGSKIKKVPRYQQIRATNKALERLRTDDKGGVVWHTQGSGKSITMVFLATKLRREEYGFDNPTIIVMTDRTDLDDQIARTFNRCGFDNPIQANSIGHLAMLLKDNYGKTIMTTIQKFQETDDDGQVMRSENSIDAEGNETRTKRKITEDGLLARVTTIKDKHGKLIDVKTETVEISELSDKKNVYVFVDEAHRSHYGFLAGFMRKALPHAKFVAFTGTPIDKTDKSTLGEFYGGRYLDKYTIKQSVEDGATLPILYDVGVPDCRVEKELLERQFELVFKDESDKKKDVLRNAGASLSKYMTAKERIKRIAEHMVEHYRQYVYPNGYKAMLVCHNRLAAITYKEVLDEMRENDLHNFQSRVVMSFSPKKDPKKYFEIATKEDDVKQVVEDFKLPFGDESELNKAGKKQFNNVAFMIVSDMLLTGYDAPVAQVMYLDKLLKEHNLLQAIARVNRTKDEKAAGLVIDYCGITDHLVEALEMFSGDLEPGDVMEKTDEEVTRLSLRHKQLVAFFKTVKENRKTERKQYIDKAVQYLEPDDVRDEFKTLLKKFNKSLNIVLPSPDALQYQDDMLLYNQIKFEAGNMYSDKSLQVSKDESKKLQKLIDEHLRATGVDSLLAEPISIIDTEKFKQEIDNTTSDKSKELKIANRIRHKIKVDMDKNPDFYKPLSEQLEALIKMRKENRITQLELFKEFEEIQKKIVNLSQETKALGFSSNREFAVYKTLEDKLDGEAKDVTLDIFEAVADELSIDNWEDKGQVKKTMRVKIKNILTGKVEAEDKSKLTVSILDIIRKNL